MLSLLWTLRFMTNSLQLRPFYGRNFAVTLYFSQGLWLYPAPVWNWISLQMSTPWFVLRMLCSRAWLFWVFFAICSHLWLPCVFLKKNSSQVQWHVSTALGRLRQGEPAWGYIVILLMPHPQHTSSFQIYQIFPKLKTNFFSLWFMVWLQAPRLLSHVGLVGVSPPVYLTKLRGHALLHGVSGSCILHALFEDATGAIYIHLFSNYWIQSGKSSVQSI